MDCIPQITVDKREGIFLFCSVMMPLSKERPISIRPDYIWDIIIRDPYPRQ